MDSSINVYIFIDASNIHYARRHIGGLLRLDSLREYFRKKYCAHTVEIFYYSAYPKEGTRAKSINDALHKFFTKIEKNFGYTVRKKPLKTIKLEDGTTKEKGNFDVEITIDMIKYRPNYDIAIMFTGDSDFLPVIHELRKETKKVYVYSTKNAVSEELRTGADGYYDIAKIPELIQKKNSP